MLDMILKSGVIGIVILVLYFVVFVIIIDRLIYFVPIRKRYKSFKQKVQTTEELKAFVLELEKRLWILSLIGHIAPFLGLLGTMTGLIKSFRVMENMGGQVDISFLAGGIWEAMLTTVMGLVVAILAFLFYRIFDQIVERITRDMSDSFVDKMDAEKEVVLEY